MLMKRSDKVAFMGVKNGETVTYHRMTNFTDMSTSKNPKEYSRQYVDEDFERSNVVGYSPSIGYSFDADSENEVHTKIREITDNELTGDAAVISILIVDLTKEAADKTGSYTGVKRNFSVIPDSEGDSTDAYTYSGNFKATGEKEEVVATTTDEWKTCTIETV